MSEDAGGGAAQEQYARQALFVMSAACEHPTLTPGCPFAVEVRPGVRDCREQCHDIPRAHGLPLPTFQEAPRPPSASRPFSVSPAFDASAAYLQAQDRRLSRWSLPALLWALKQHLTRADVDVVGRTRDEEVDLCLMELARRDFDVDALVRLGMGEEIMEAVLLGTVIPRLARGDDVPAGPEAGTLSDAPEGWQELLDDLLAVEPGEGSELPLPAGIGPDKVRAARELARILRGSFPRRLMAWIVSAPLAALATWTPPGLDRFPAETEQPQPTAEERNRQRWLVDRFTVAYYDDWDRESRHLEFRWLRNDCEPPCAQALMDLRERREDDLARTIAVAAVLAPVGPERHLSSLRQKGLDLLRAGRRAAAVAVFEAVRELDWDLPEPHNNYGFALLPDAPEQALAALRLANDLGYGLTVNSANQALALALLSRDHEVLEIAEAIVANYDDEDAGDAFLWEPGRTLAGDPVLVPMVSPRDYILEAAALVAGRGQDQATARHWRTMLSARTRGNPDEPA